MRHFLRERAEAVRALPEPWQEADEDAERVRRGGEEGARLAALEQERVAEIVACEQANSPVAVPALERVRLLLRLAVRVDELENARRAVGEIGADGVAAGALSVRLREGQLPLLGRFGDEPRHLAAPVRQRLRHAGTLWADSGCGAAW